MSKKLNFGIALLLVMMLVAFMTMPVVAQADEEGNVICEMDDEEGYVTTALGGLIGTVTTLIVTAAALVAIVFGAGYTLASAANPGKEEYVENRNKAVKYGAGTLIVLYGANAIVSEFGEDRALDFSCILPFA